jgi:hypothetical protein
MVILMAIFDTLVIQNPVNVSTKLQLQGRQGGWSLPISCSHRLLVMYEHGISLELDTVVSWSRPGDHLQLAFILADPHAHLADPLQIFTILALSSPDLVSLYFSSTVLKCA